MRRIAIGLGIVCLTMAGLAPPLAAQPARRAGPCGQIQAACASAGFTRGGAKAGSGIEVDCVRPIMQGASPPARAGKPLPSVDPQVVAACRARNPNFGQARNAPSAVPPETPAPPPSPPPAAPAPRPQANGASPRPPNIVFVLTDDLAINLVQFMPHVLKMQEEGATFTNYFVTDSLCCPSRSSIFTGRYPHDTGIFRNTGKDGGYLAYMSRGNDQATFATALAGAGYHTAMLGKYLNGYLPAQHPPGRGWSMWAVAGNGYPEFNYAFNQDGKVVRYGSNPDDYLTDVASRMASQFIRQQAGTPFAIEVATFAPHAPYTPAPRDANAFPDLRAPRTPAFDAAPDRAAPAWLQKLPPLSPKDMARIDTDFRKRAQAVQAVDTMIGELQAAVAAIGQQGNTYFVFSSDNGYHMGEHRLMPGKMTAFDTDIHVPLIVTGPGVAPGRKIEQITENVDLCPTFEELAGAATPANVDGRSLAPLLHGGAVSSWRTAALIEHHGPVRDLSEDPDAPPVRGGNPPSYEAIRTPNGVYVEYVTGEKEYHDLKSDPDELHNSFAGLPAPAKANLHALLTAVQNCHDGQSCHVADAGSRSAE